MVSDIHNPTPPSSPYETKEYRGGKTTTVTTHRRTWQPLTEQEGLRGLFFQPPFCSFSYTSQTAVNCRGGLWFLTGIYLRSVSRRTDRAPRLVPRLLTIESNLKETGDEGTG